MIVEDRSAPFERYDGKLEKVLDVWNGLVQQRLDTPSIMFELSDTSWFAF